MFFIFIINNLLKKKIKNYNLFFSDFIQFDRILFQDPVIPMINSTISIIDLSYYIFIFLIILNCKIIQIDTELFPKKEICLIFIIFFLIIYANTANSIKNFFF